MGVSASSSFDDFQTPVRLSPRQRRRASPVAARGADAGAAEGAALMAALQPLIERQNGLVVHLVGAERGCGNTRVTQAVARAAARHDWCRLLVIDASHLGGSRPAPSGRGLVGLHASGGDLPAPGSGIAAIPLTGPDAGVPRPSELRALYASLRQRFSLVLVDCPPIGAAPDTAILSSLADQTILVVRAEQSRAGHAAEAKRLLIQAGVTRLGLVLNGARARIPAALDRLL